MMNQPKHRRLRTLRRGIERALPAGATPASWLGIQTLEPRLLMSVVVETTHVFATGGSAGDQFGQSLDISGDLMIVGASGRDTAGGSNAGAAQIFQRSGTAWSLMATLTANDGTAGDLFGSAVAIDGDFAVITAAGDNAGAGVNSGSAYVFKRTGDVWSQLTKLSASDGGAGDQFGVSADINGNRIIIGAFQDDDAATNVGSAYIFQDSGAGFTQTTKLVGDANAFAEFGSSVSISGDFVVVGAHGDSNASGSNAGAAYIFNFNGTQWQKQTKLKSTDLAAFDQLGISVSIDGDTVIVGASLSDDNGSASGSAYVFERSGTNWSQKAKLIAPDAAPGDQFGRSVSINGDRIAVGASDDNLNDTVNNSGSVYIFGRTGNQWVNVSQLVASDPSSDDNLGRAVAINGIFVAGGANFDDTSAGVNAGSVYVLQLGTVQQAAPVTATLVGNGLQITGTANDDVINVSGISNGVVRVTGTGIDQQFSLVNAITINGLAGNDTITVANNVRDTNGNFIGVVINGGAGNDTITGGSGNDIINGGAGDDNIDGGPGDDVLTGDAGNDLIIGGGGIDTIDSVISSPQAIIGENGAKSITFVDADGTKVSVALKGPGTATVTLGGTGITQTISSKGITVDGTNITIDEIALTNTTNKSTLTINGSGGDKLATIGRITSSTAMASISGKAIDLIGDGIVFTGDGAVGSITLHDLLNGADIIAPGIDVPKGVSIKVNAIGAGSLIDLGGDLKKLSGTGDLLGDVTATVISSITTRGSLGGTISATEMDSKGVSIGSLKVGAINDATINALGGVKTITVTSWQAGDINAQWLGKLTSKGELNIDIALSGADIKGVSLDSLKALSLSGVDVTAPGSIKSITVNDWLSGSLAAESLGKLTSKGDLGVDLTFSGADTKGFSLGSLKAVTLTGVDVTATGSIKSIDVTDWQSGSLAAESLGKLTSKGGLGVDLTFSGADTKGVSLGSLKALTIVDLDLTAPGAIKSIAVTDWVDGAISAGSVGNLAAKNNFGADLTLTDGTIAKTLGSAKITGTLGDAIWKINGASGAISAGATNNALSIDVQGILASLSVKNDAGGHFAAGDFNTVSIGGNLTDAHFLAGTHLGNDGQLGGIGADADTFASGTIGSFSVGGQITNSIIGAGLDPTDGDFKNGDEIVIGGQASFIKSLKLGDSVSDTSLIAAGLFPNSVVIQGVSVDPSTDPRFLLG